MKEICVDISRAGLQRISVFVDTPEDRGRALRTVERTMPHIRALENALNEEWAREQNELAAQALATIKDEQQKSRVPLAPVESRPASKETIAEIADRIHGSSK
jgi:hypothetical protein